MIYRLKTNIRYIIISFIFLIVLYRKTAGYPLWMEISFNLTITMREVVSINSIYYTIISNGFFSPSFFPTPLPIKAALYKQMVETLKTTLYAVYFMMTHYTNCYLMSRWNKNQTEISDRLSVGVQKWPNDISKEKGCIFQLCASSIHVPHSRAAEMGEGNLLWAPHLLGLQFAKSKESVRH